MSYTRLKTWADLGSVAVRPTSVPNGQTGAPELYKARKNAADALTSASAKLLADQMHRDILAASDRFSEEQQATLDYIRDNPDDLRPEDLSATARTRLANAKASALDGIWMPGVRGNLSASLDGKARTTQRQVDNFARGKVYDQDITNTTNALDVSAKKLMDRATTPEEAADIIRHMYDRIHSTNGIKRADAEKLQRERLDPAIATYIGNHSQFGTLQDQSNSLRELEGVSKDQDQQGPSYEGGSDLTEAQKARGNFRTGSVSVVNSGDEKQIGTYGSGAGDRDPVHPSTPYGIYPLGNARNTKLGTVVPLGKAGADTYSEDDFQNNQGFDPKTGRNRSAEEFHRAFNSELRTKGCLSLTDAEYKKLLPEIESIRKQYGQVYAAVNPDGSVKIFGKGDPGEPDIRQVFGQQKAETPYKSAADAAAPAGGKINVDKDGNIDPVSFSQAMEAKVAKSSLNGTVPEWGKQFGITTGSPKEWARFFTMVQQQESGNRVAKVNDDGSLQKFSTTKAGEQSYGPGQFKPGEYGLKDWADVNDPDKVGDAYIKVAEAGKTPAYFGSVKRPNETLQHSAWYDSTVAPKVMALGGPTIGKDQVADKDGQTVPVDKQDWHDIVHSGKTPKTLGEMAQFMSPRPLKVLVEAARKATDKTINIKTDREIQHIADGDKEKTGEDGKTFYEGLDSVAGSPDVIKAAKDSIDQARWQRGIVDHVSALSGATNGLGERDKFREQVARWDDGASKDFATRVLDTYEKKLQDNPVEAINGFKDGDGKSGTGFTFRPHPMVQATNAYNDNAHLYGGYVDKDGNLVSTADEGFMQVGEYNFEASKLRARIEAQEHAGVQPIDQTTVTPDEAKKYFGNKDNWKKASPDLLNAQIKQIYEQSMDTYGPEWGRRHFDDVMKIISPNSDAKDSEFSSDVQAAVKSALLTGHISLNDLQQFLYAGQSIKDEHEADRAYGMNQDQRFGAYDDPRRAGSFTLPKLYGGTGTGDMPDFGTLPYQGERAQKMLESMSPQDKVDNAEAASETAKPKADVPTPSPLSRFAKVAPSIPATVAGGVGAVTNAINNGAPEADRSEAPVAPPPAAPASHPRAPLWDILDWTHAQTGNIADYLSSEDKP